MKFILNEKFTLNEKFILTEATDKELADLQNFLNTVSAEHKKVIDTATDFRNNNEFLQKLSLAKENADKAINDPRSDYPNMREWVVQYVETFEQNVKEQNLDINNSSFAKINEVIRQIKQSKDYETGAKSAENSRDDLKKNYKLLSELIEKVFYLGGQTSHENINKDIEEITKAFEELKSAIEKIKADKILDLIPEGGITVVLADLAKLLPLTDEKLLDSSTEKYFDTCINNLTNINKQLNKLISSANNEKKKADTASNIAKAEQERANSQKKPWADLYKEASTKGTTDAFWKDYFKTEWGENADAVEKFGIAFIEELKNYGFDSIQNPFVFFLKNNPIIFKKIIDTNRYVSLHNAVANRLISGADLRGAGELGKANIIFSTYLYDTHGTTEFDDYLKQQQRASKTKKAELENQTGGNIVNICKNLLYADGLLDRLDQPSPIRDNVTNAPLRSLIDIKQKLEQLVGEDTSNEKKAATSEEIDSSLKDIDEATSKKILSYFIDFFSAVAPKTIEKLLTAIPALAKTADENRPNLNEKKAYYKQFNLEYSSYSAEQITKVIESLAEKAKIYTPEKK